MCRAVWLDLFVTTLDQAITAYKTTEQHMANGDFSTDAATQKQLTGHSEHTSAAEFTEACANFVSKYAQLFHQYNRANTTVRNQLEIMAKNFAETRSEYANFEATNATRFRSLSTEGTER